MMWREHRGILIILIAFIALGIIYSTTTPLFEAPDEQWHFAFVQHVATGRGLPVQSTGQLTHLARQEGSQPPLYYLLAAGATFWIETSDYPGIVWENPHYGYNVPGVVNDNKNLFIHTSQESFPWRGATLAIHLARFVSLAMGALAVLFTYLLALEIFSERKFLAASAAAFVAFVPQFLFVSSAVSNDSTIVALAAAALWLIVRRTTEAQRRTTEVILLGVVCGLAALAKVSGLGLFVLAALVLLWRMWEAKFSRASVLNFELFTFTFLLVAGWWYARNFVLYGELTGTQMMTQIFGARQTPLTPAELWVQLNEVWETFWVGFGWGNIRANPAVYSTIGVFILLSLIGWLITIRNSQFKIQNSKCAILLAWITIMLGALLNWMQTTQAPHGRLFFPALPAIAVLLAIGFTALNFRFAPLAASALFGVAVFAPFAWLQPAYAYPPTLTADQIPASMQTIDLIYDGKIKLLGYAVSSRRAKPGDALTLTLYWQARAPIDEDYSIGIRVIDANQIAIGARDSYPGHGMLPTRLWRAGQIIRDEYWLPIAGNATPGVAQMIVALYERTTKHDLTAVDPQGNAVTPRIGEIKISPSLPVVAPRVRNEANVVFGKQITLIGYDVIHAASPNPGFELVLYWKRIAPIETDYTTFVHVFDANGQRIAQQDRMPPNNPTSLWDDGEIVIERFQFDVPAKQIAVGWYRADTGERLPLADASGDAYSIRVEDAR